MALVSTQTITGTGTSNIVSCGDGDHVVTVRATGTISATLEASEDGSNWDAATDANGDITYSTSTSSAFTRVAGGMFYRLNVATNGTAIVFTVRRAG